MSSSAPRVIVVGGGIGGLALAQALVRAGIDVQVHERNASPEGWLHGYRININPHGARALHDCLPPALWKAFVATSATPPGGITFRTETLAELFTLTRADMIGGSTDAADGQYGVSRMVLRRLLLAGLDDVVRFGAEFERYTVEPDGQVTAHFADGSTATGDVLVGADGANSRVRTQLLPHAGRVATGATTIAARLPLTDDTRAWLPDFLTDGMALVMPASGSWTVFTSAFPGRDTVAGALTGGLDLAGLGIDRDALLDTVDDYVLCALIADTRSLPTHLHDLDGPALAGVAAGMLDGWHPVLRRIYAECDPATVAPLVVQQSRTVDPWPSSAVTVLGDAVHNMSPVGGLGANTALRDAAELARQLIAVRNGAPLVPSIGAYEQRMREWGYAALREAASNTRRATTSNRLSRHAGRTYFRVRRILRGGPDAPLGSGRSGDRSYPAGTRG
ncbi:FAD-dependent oxidoreductase [Pseudonocardia sp. CA-107938]|uniref:FAD-dependent oxidoreductase n=1 Tax=Pseudonocardia sp. CA-107938 TaxID=3240021 RepID=UPI003D920CFB